MIHETIKTPDSEIYNFLDCPFKEREEIKEDIIKEVPKTKYGYLGFKERKHLRKFLNYWMDRRDNQIALEKPNPKEVNQIIEDALKKLSGVIGKEKIYIYVIPEFKKFVKRNMEGVMGFCPHRRHLVIQPTIAKNWKSAMKDLVAHELAHALSKNYFMFSKENPPKMKETIIAEGLAEKFKESMFRKKRSPWTKVFPKSKAKNYLEKVNLYLNKQGHEYHARIFFNKDKEFPFWTGYTLGYHLVSEYLKDKKSVNWKKLLREDLEKIFDEAYKKF